MTQPPKSAMIPVAMLTLFLLGAIPCQSEDPDPIDMGDSRELFVDDYLADRFEGTELKLHHPVPAETAVEFDRPWEGLFCGYVTVIEDGDTYRMYYRGLPTAGRDGSEVEVSCYAESSDGINWTKPNLGIHEVNGTLDNNAILKDAAPASHNFSPFLDTKPGIPKEERFKALGGTIESGLFAFVSPDGKNWKKLREEAVITDGALDSQNVAFWSETEECYVCYLRTWTKGEFAGYRTISRTTSTDFFEWSDLVEMEYGETTREHLYTNQTRPYFRAPQIYVSIAARFMPGRRVISTEQAEAIGGDPNYSGDISDNVLMTSRGGNHYDRTFMEGFIRPGIGLGNWTSRTNYPALGVVPTGPDEMSMYVQRNYGQTTHHLQRCVLRKDGFVSVNAPYSGGEMVTKPLTFSGKELEINYSTSAAGSVKVEIQDCDGKPVEGFSLEDCLDIVGDEIERVVDWKTGSDVSGLAGKPICLRFVMKDADLYSIRFRE